MDLTENFEHNFNHHPNSRTKISFSSDIYPRSVLDGSRIRVSVRIGFYKG